MKLPQKPTKFVKSRFCTLNNTAKRKESTDEDKNNKLTKNENTRKA